QRRSDVSFLLLCFSTTVPRPPTSTLFPYTTLFRSLIPPVDDLPHLVTRLLRHRVHGAEAAAGEHQGGEAAPGGDLVAEHALQVRDRKSTRLNSSHVKISYAVFCLKKKKRTQLWGSD